MIYTRGLLQREKYRIIGELIFSCLIFLVCIITTLYIYYNNNNNIYKWLYILPMVYGFCFLGVLRKYIFNPRRLFRFTFTILSGLRYVILPVCIVMTSYYRGRSIVDPTQQSFNMAFYLMSIELVVCCGYMIYLDKNAKANINNKELVFPKNKLIYILATIVIVCMLGGMPKCLKAINIILPNATVQPEHLNTIEHLIVLGFNTIKQLICILGIVWCKRKYDKTRWSRYALIAGLIIVANLSIYIGDNRSDFLLMGLASVVIYCITFSKFSKAAIVIGTILIAAIVVALTMERDIYFVSQGSNRLLDFTEMMQVYLGGPYNVAMAVDTASYFPEGRTLFNLLYDFARPTLGINILVKNMPLQYSNVFYNSRIYFSDHMAQIIPMIGEGYYFLGPIFAPLISMVFIKIASVLENKMYYTKRIELIYFFSLTSIRLGFIMGQNATVQMNDLSFNLFLPLILIWLNDRVVLRKNKYVHDGCKTWR